MKPKVILDTDVYNEVDDQFALAYLLKSQDRLELEAVTIAPFTKEGYDPANSIAPSYEAAQKIYHYCGVEDTSNIYKGATDYFGNDPDQTNAAVDKIIETALRNDKTYILCIGCITNLALAIKKAPEIVQKIEVVWLGTKFLFMKNDDFNFRQDAEAVRHVFESGVKLTVVPTYPVTSNLVISIYELEHRIGGKNALCDYFLSIFGDDFGKTKTRRPLWDISVIAYMLDPSLFQTLEVSCPIIRDDLTFEPTQGRHKITFVQMLDSNGIYDNLFAKITN